jgi:hypothetical protein
MVVLTKDSQSKQEEMSFRNKYLQNFGIVWGIIAIWIEMFATFYVAKL